MTVINTNTASINAQFNLNKVNKEMEAAMEQLSSGKRINSASDDAAGLAISTRMDSQVKGIGMAIKNAADAQSLVDTTDGAHQEITNILQRMRELSIQASNDTNVASDRVSMQSEVTQLQAEINRISSQTTWNGMALLDGTFASKQFQIGAEANQTISMSVGTVNTANIGAHQVNSVVNIASGTSNGMDAAGDVVITGAFGTSTIDVSGTDKSAKGFAAAVNAVTSETGVSATAITKVKLSGFSAADTVSFTVNGTTTGAVAIASASDLRDLRDAINAIAGETGVSAALSGGQNSALELTDIDGDDISIGSFSTTSTAYMLMTALDKDGNTATDNDGGEDLVVMLQDTGIAQNTYLEAAAYTVTGQVTMTSDESYTLATTHNDAETDAITQTGSTVVGTLDTLTADGEFFGATPAADGTVTTSSTLSSVGTVNISTTTGAANAINIIDGALARISNARSDLGAVSNRLDHTMSNLGTIQVNITASQSRIEDADFAKVTGDLTKSQIMSQAATAMLAQANASKQGVLSLLQG
ncbi:flagellin [Lentibacter algarum]|uniref:flagellin N-terminal helical domain-containing protein n=1 Tax=Lentibacter algarum TaxID=576131 RepID=UPI00339D4C6B